MLHAQNKKFILQNIFLRKFESFKKYFKSNRFPLWLKIFIRDYIAKSQFIKAKKGFYSFPYKEYSHNNLIGQAIRINDSEGSNCTYYSQYYEETRIHTSNSLLITDTIHKTETYKGNKYIDSKNIEINYNKDSILPLSIFDSDDDNSKEGKLNIKIKGANYLYKNIQCNRFHPIKLEDSGTLSFSSPKPLIIGEPINIKQIKKTSAQKKFVLVIFIDGFGSSWFQMTNINKLIPNTINFFKTGLTFKNCFSNSEWTLPSLASMFTGKYAHKSKVFHPRSIRAFDAKSKTIAQYFKDDGYYTQMISGNRKQHLSSGFCTGFDRTIYKHLLKHHEIIYELIESHRVFNERNMFNWLSFFDTHHPINGTPSFSSKSNLNLNDLLTTNSNRKIKSPFKTYCKFSLERQKEEIKQWDFHMKQLYDFIEENYLDSEILVTLVSDHGDNQMENINNIPELLNTGRTRVPLMIRGINNPNKTSEELIENVDLLPSLLNECNICYEKKSIDGNLPFSLGGKKRNYIFSESIYPNQTYKATIKDLKYEAYIESKEDTEDSGTFNLKDPAFKLFEYNIHKEINDEKLKEKYKSYFSNYDIW